MTKINKNEAFIPAKNYILSAVIVVVIIGLTYYAFAWYNVLKQNKVSTSYLVKEKYISNEITDLHEVENIFTEIAELRASYMNQKKDIKNAENLNNKLNQLIAVAEDYPDLKASEQYLNLQKTLTKLESQLQAARRIYNLEVTNYNNQISVIPSNIIAIIFGFKEAKLFEIEDYKKENVNIKLEG
jgi:LemA protein